MAKPQTLAEYKEATGRRFRRTKEQMKRGLSREASFQEWLKNGAMPSTEEEKAKREPGRPRIRRTKQEIKRGLTIEEALEERKKDGRFNKKDPLPMIEKRGYVCGHDERNCQVPHKDPDFENIPNQCVGFMVYKNEDGIDVIVNCVCDCHRHAFQINKYGKIMPDYIKLDR